MVALGKREVSYQRGTPLQEYLGYMFKNQELENPHHSLDIPVQGFLEIKDSHRPYGGPMLLGLALL